MTMLPEGRVLNGKWTIGRPLGVGGAGTVYAATHRNGSRAAVKVLHALLAEHPEQVARFVREGYIANQIEHPGVVAALDDDRTEDGLVYLVLELLDGRSLASILEERAPLPVPEALRIADAILDVLAAAHEKGVIHRDVKPANVLVLRNGGLKLLDFGIARVCGQAHRADATQMGAVLGTPGFMPPEQASGRVELIDARTDLWATAAVLFAMLTGKRLFSQYRTFEALARAVIEPAPPIRTVAPRLPSDVARLVDRGLAFDREERYPSARRMQGAVRFALGQVAPADASPASGASAAAPPVSVPAPSSRPIGRRRRAGYHVALGAAGACALAVCAWLGDAVLAAPTTSRRSGLVASATAPPASAAEAPRPRVALAAEAPPSVIVVSDLPDRAVEPVREHRPRPVAMRDGGAARVAAPPPRDPLDARR